MAVRVAGRSNYTGNYKAVLFIDSVCSVAPPPNGTFIPSVDDTMEFSVIFRVEDHPTLSNSSTDAVGSGLTYSPGAQWLGSQTVIVTDYLQTTYIFTNQTVTVLSLSVSFPFCLLCFALSCLTGIIV